MEAKLANRLKASTLTKFLTQIIFSRRKKTQFDTSETNLKKDVISEIEEGNGDKYKLSDRFMEAIHVNFLSLNVSLLYLY